MLKRLFLVTFKNLRIAYRSKRFILISILSPIVLILLIVLLFSTQDVSNVRIGIIDNSISENNLLQNLSQSMVIVPYAEDECKDNIKAGTVHACVVIPENDSEIFIYTDFSKTNLASSIVSAITKGITQSSEDLEIDVIKGLLLSSDRMQEALTTSLGNFKGIKKNAEDTLAQVNSLDTEGGADVSGLKTVVSDFSQDIEESKGPLIEISSGISNSKSTIDGISVNLEEKKSEVELERASCTEALIAINLQSSLEGCASTNPDITEYRSLVYVPCEDHKEIIADTQALFLCDSLNIARSILELKNDILDNQSQELNQSINELREIRDSIEANENNINTFINDLDSMQASLSEIESEIDASPGSYEIGELKTSLSSDLGELLSTIEESESNLEQDNFQYQDIVTSSAGNPLNIISKSISSERSNTDFLVLIAFVLLLTFSTVLISSSLLVKEKSSPGFFRNLISPTPNIIFILGTFISTFIISLTFSIIFLSFITIGGTYIPTNPLDAVVSLIAIQATFVLLGMFVAVLFEKRETMILGTVTLLTILFMLSGILVPIEKLSPEIGSIISFSPVAITMELLRKIILFNLSTADVQLELFTLFFSSLALFAAVYYVNKIRMKF